MIWRRTALVQVLGVAMAGVVARYWPFGSAEQPSGEQKYPPPQGPAKVVDVRSLGAKGDGRTDDTRAFQAAQDQLADGGTIEVGPGTYNLRSIAITNRYVTVSLASDAILRRIGPAGPNDRGMFVVALIGAHFTLKGGTIDLNGEGPMEIGKPGRLRNIYAEQTLPGVRAISGPANAAIFALRASFITVSGVVIKNTGETALLLRNCGHVQVEDCRFSNVANFGVEFSFVGPGTDGGLGPMPYRGNCSVRRCEFENIDDLGLGTGNGVGVGGGGGRALGPFAGYEISECSFRRCQRDIHFEFEAGAWIEQLKLLKVRSVAARQGSFGLVGARDVVVDDYVALDPGSAPTAAFLAEFPSIYGGVLSGDFDRIRLRNLHILDRRQNGVRMGRGGTIGAGDREFFAGDAAFIDADRGSLLGVQSGNPNGVWLVGEIIQVISPQRVVLDVTAGVDVRNGVYAYGGATREGLILTHGRGVVLENVELVAGHASGLPGEPAAAALRIEGLEVPLAASSTSILPPPDRKGTGVGIRIVGDPAQAANARAGISITGFAVATSR